MPLVLVWSKILMVLVLVGNLSNAQATEVLQGAVPGYPASLKTVLAGLLAEYGRGTPSVPLLVQLAEIYMDMGDDLLVDPAERIAAYQQGAEFAQLGLARDPKNADAHFLYAANLGHVAQLRGLIASALSLNKVFSHVQTAVSLNPHHPAALHMLGMMYDGLPWFMGGDAQKAVHFLRQAVEADENYSHARLNLAKLYLERGEDELARVELESILGMQAPRSLYAWSQSHYPEARELLNTLVSSGVVPPMNEHP